MHIRSPHSLHALLRSERGSVIIMTGLAICLLIAAVGAAVDMSRGQILQMRISSALDSAGLAAATLLSTQPDPQITADKYFKMNFPADYLQSQKVVVTAKLSADKSSLHLTASTVMPTSFMHVAGINTMPINVISDVRLGTPATPACTGGAPFLIYVANYGNKRIDVFDNKGTYQTTFGAPQLQAPWYIAIDGAGNAWVTDNFDATGGSSPSGDIKEFNATTGAFIQQFADTKAQTPGQFSQYPDGITTDNAGNVWASDPGVAWSGGGIADVLEFTPAAPSSYIGYVGTYTWQPTSPNGSSPVPMSGPVGLVFDPSNDLFVVSQNQDTIIKIDVSVPGGKQLMEFGGDGSAPGQMNKAWGITLDSKQNVWVTDSGNNRVEEWDKTGTFVRAVGGVAPGNGPGQFNFPLGIAVDTCDNVWVADSYNNRIVELDNSGNYVTSIGVGPDPHPGFLNSPFGLAIAKGTSSVTGGTPGVIYIDQ